MSYPRAFRNELMVLLQQYPSNLTVYYNSYGDMDNFYGTFIIRENRLYIKQTTKPEEFEKPLTVKSFLEILESATTENLEVSTYHESYRGGYNFDCNMILDNIYFR
jgi:hypothetical protein